MNETDTIVRVQDGKIVAIGGLMSVDVRDDRGGLPGVGECRSRRPVRATPIARSAKSELVILIKPTVIQSDAATSEPTERSRPDAPSAFGTPSSRRRNRQARPMNYLDSTFGLRELPFGITPDTSFFFACRSIRRRSTRCWSRSQRRRLHQDHRRSRHRQDAAVPAVPVDAVDASYVTAYIPNPYLEPRTLLLALAEELGVPGESERTRTGW